MKEIEEARKLYKKANKVMVLTGAGMSTESGIKDFRSDDGLYSKNFKHYSPEEILSLTFFNNHPDLFWQYLRENMNYENVIPNKAYFLLSEEEKKGKISCIVTQNIDSLHEKAGSKNIIEIHGNIDECYCDMCDNKTSFRSLVNGDIDIKCKNKGCSGYYRPNIVLYEEGVPLLTETYKQAEKCDLLLILGTSLLVYPAAQIPVSFLARNLPVIIINKQRTPYSRENNVIEINESITEVLEQILAE